MGSGLNGAAVGAGIQVDFTRYMNAVLEVAPDASWVRVQPGVVHGLAQSPPAATTASSSPPTPPARTTAAWAA